MAAAAPWRHDAWEVEAAAFLHLWARGRRRRRLRVGRPPGRLRQRRPFSCGYVGDGGRGGVYEVEAAAATLLVGAWELEETTMSSDQFFLISN